MRKRSSSIHPDPARSEGALELTLLMPCLNEHETIGTCVSKAKAALEKHGIHGEVLIADNGSDDGSSEVARAAGARVIHVPDKGYGAALRAGIDAAHSDFIIMGDADDSYDWTKIDAFFHKLREGFDLVMGCRFP
ncbi:MAG: glycosyltransferase family 2 protein, partial [Gammaproteobacteria bacterium]